jgi:drug/metabolite transporter (DMT)-like permease
MILAALKLRKRNLGPLLDANGWAINTKALVNIPFGATMTQVASLPPGTLPLAADPFAQKKPRWGRWIALIIFVTLIGILVAWGFGAFDARLPDGWTFPSVWSRLSHALKPPKVDLQGIIPSPATGTEPGK